MAAKESLRPILESACRPVLAYAVAPSLACGDADLAGFLLQSVAISVSMWVRLLHGSRGGSVLGIRVGGPRLLSQHLTTASVLVVVALSWIALEQNVSRPRVVLSTDLDICRGAICSM